MSLLATDSIKVYSESVGVPNLSEDSAIVVAQDVEYRLREILQDAIKFMNHSKRNFLSVNDVNDALSNRNIEKIFGYSSMTTTAFKPVSVGNVYFLEDQEVDFDEVLRSPLPKMPQPKTFGCHWLAIEGIQPLLAQNPNQTLESISEKTVSSSSTQNNMQSEIETKPLIKHILPKEQQVYFENMTSLLINCASDALPDILKKIRQELGLQLLLPYFVQFAAEMVARSLRNLTTLVKMIKLLEALLDNRNVFVEPYLHQMMPIILTCIVGKQLCKEPSENHWALRENAAALVKKICKSFKLAYSTIRPRVTKTLLKALLDPSKPLTTHYGAIVGLSAIGHETIKLLVLPHVKKYGEMLEPLLKSENTILQSEANKCYQALLSALVDCISQDQERDQMVTISEYQKIFGLFGEPLVALISAKLMKDDS